MSEPVEIVFSEDPHSYSVGGIVRPSTTQILADLGFTDYSMCTEQARERGKAVHQAVHFLEDNDLDWNTVHPIVRPYLEAYLLMKEQTGWIPHVREHRVFCPVYNYCGTLDGFGEMPRLGLEEVLADYKSGMEQAARYQTASYASAYNKPLAKRCTIRLQNNGKYSITWYDKPENRKDVAGWRAIVTAYHLKHGGM